MEQIRILYIDDKPDPNLDEYFDRYYKIDEYEKVYEIIQFDPNNGYESLLQDSKVQSANIIFVDSRLFENKTAVSGKFTGEEFKLVLQKFYPFIEVIVITQNGKDPDIDMIEKFKYESGYQYAWQYYSNEIPKCINNAIKRIKQYRILASRINQNDSWEKLLKEKVLDTLEGTNIYDSLTKSDIDELINAFKLIQERINGWWL